MSDNLRQLITNAIYAQLNSDPHFSHQRQLAFGGGHMGLDCKRSSAYAEYGFPSNITFENLYLIYDRTGLGHGAVNKLSGKCWETHPWVIEGTEDKEADDFTEFDTKAAAVFTDEFWRIVFEVDRRRLIGHYSAIILRLSDAKTVKGYSAPVKTKSAVLAGIIPVWENALKPSKKGTFGEILTWNYKDDDGNEVEVHNDRVIIFGDASKKNTPFLKPAYNNLVTLEKVEGGSGESFLKNAARQIGINFDKEVDIESIAAAVGKKPDEIQEVFDDVVKGLNRGEDNAIVTIGASVTPLSTSMPDPRPVYDINVLSACASWDIPSAILIGNQEGERSSTENNRYFNARCQSRRNNELRYDVAAIVSRLMKFGVLPSVTKFTVMWDDLNEADTSTKLDNATKMADINSKAAATGAPVFTDEEIRVAAGFEGESDAGASLGETDEN